MLQQVILETANPLTLDIGGADPNSLLTIKNITGLTAADVTIFSGDYAGPGGYYQGRRVSRRFPVFTFKLNENYRDNIDVSDIRDMLYRQFLDPMPDTDGVQVRLVDDRRPDRYFIGYTETMPADLFVKSPEAQVTMVCMDGVLKSVTPVEVHDGSYISWSIAYDGSADTGLELDIVVGTEIDQVVIENNGRLMTLEGDFFTDDVITISTVYGNRFIKVNGIDRMTVLKAGSFWLQLTQASNSFKVYSAVADDGLVSVSRYSYRSAWWGI